MKTIIRLPTEQFAFIEQEFDRYMEPEEAIEAYTALQRAYKGESGEGLTDKEFNGFLDRYLTDGTGSTELYATMNLSQQACIQTIKRSLKRIKAHGEVDVS